MLLYRLNAPAWGLAALVLALSCGGEKVGEGGFCERDKDCREGLICLQNICTEPVANGCHPPCESFEACIDGNCVPIDPGTDKDGDGWPNTHDCDDLDPFTYPEDTDNGIPGGFEYCDGKDNDCDSETDEGCWPCRDGDSRPCGTDVGECTPGVQVCADGKWGECSGMEPTPEEADGLDNDCDGATDEGLPCQEGQTHPCGTDEGECSPGQQHCENDAWSECLEGQMPVAETCDDLDNDCDGLTDDGFPIDQVCDGIGECGDGTYECASSYEIRCSTEVTESQPEACNQLDDDCDGSTDEDFNLGGACTGIGECGAGVLECFSETEAGCSTNPGGSQDQSSGETCDRKDNDCDGQTDEDFDTQTDPLNCGSCGTACDPGEICVAGACSCGGTGPDCTPGQVCCGTTCYPSSPTGCDDGDPCTYDDSCDGSVCAGTAYSCSDSACYTRSCDGSGGCNATPKAAGTNCGGGKQCRSNGECCNWWTSCSGGGCYQNCVRITCDKSGCTGNCNGTCGGTCYANCTPGR